MDKLIEEVSYIFRERYRANAVRYFTEGLGEDEYVGGELAKLTPHNFLSLISIKLKYLNEKCSERALNRYPGELPS